MKIKVKAEVSTIEILCFVKFIALLLVHSMV